MTGPLVDSVESPATGTARTAPGTGRIATGVPNGPARGVPGDPVHATGGRR
ncbi:hypothetical protein [Streptosporangium sp. H16]|uniref:hypothetical protein n=1 Tax=Streptosporangium sp. H16 TaxID=3444184 RepID=UPI003F7910B6